MESAATRPKIKERPIFGHSVRSGVKRKSFAFWSHSDRPCRPLNPDGRGDPVGIFLRPRAARFRFAAAGTATTRFRVPNEETSSMEVMPRPPISRRSSLPFVTADGPPARLRTSLWCTLLSSWWWPRRKSITRYTRTTSITFESDLERLTP